MVLKMPQPPSTTGKRDTGAKDGVVHPRRTKIILDTDPGIDDAMAILIALQSPELEVIGITTIFGNAETPVATRNALYLLEVAGIDDVPVSEGNSEPLSGGSPRVADFAHGSDGLGNTFSGRPRLEKIATPACDFLVEKILEHPGEVTVVAFGPLTNLAQAFQKEQSFAEKVHKVFVLGGALFSSGNVNPAAEANIYDDPEAADIVFTSGADITVIGLNITTQVLLNEGDLSMLNDSAKGYRNSLHDMCRFYKEWHKISDGIDGIFVHGPTCLAAVLEPSYFTYRSGHLRVETLGICRGHTLFDMGLKRWNTKNPWSVNPEVNVAWTVDIHNVLKLVKDRLKLLP